MGQLSSTVLYSVVNQIRQLASKRKEQNDDLSLCCYSFSRRSQAGALPMLYHNSCSGETEVEDLALLSRSK